MTATAARWFAASRPGPGRFLIRWGAYLPLKVLAFLYALLRFEVFIFSGNSSFFSLREVPLYRWLGKRTVFVSVGSDSRPAYLSGIYKDDLPAGEDRIAWMLERDAVTCRNLARIDAGATMIVDYPVLAFFRRRTCCSGLALGFPAVRRGATAEAPSPRAHEGNPGTVRILHAPSRPRAKGSDRIRAIVARLRDEGKDLEYVEVVGRPNQEVLEEIARSDLVVDECYSDLPLGGLGVEAALLGKPVVVGGYFAPMMERYLAPDETPPSSFVLPDEMEGAVRRLVEDPGLRASQGARLRDFVATRWTSKAVAQRYLRVLSGEAPAAWFFEPAELTYFLGWGVTEDEVRENVAAIVAGHGEKGLRLDHVPELRSRMLRYLGIGP